MHYLPRVEFFAPFAAASMVLAVGYTMVGRLLANQRRMERKLDQLLAHAGLAAEAPVSAEVMQLAKIGRQAAAIKLHRFETGAGLDEAKAAIDAAVAQGRREAGSA